MKNDLTIVPLIVLAVSLAAGPRSLQLDTHGANLAQRAGKYVEAVPEQGLRSGGRGGRGLNFRRHDIGRVRRPIRRLA
jgi:hypothetical protein